MNGGKYFISQKEYNDFLSIYSNSIKLNPTYKLYLSERITKCKEFKFFLDIDFDEATWKILNKPRKEFLEYIIKEISEIYKTFYSDSLEYIISLRLDYKIHITFSNFIVNRSKSLSIVQLLRNNLVKWNSDINWEKVIDTQVYISGLRMIGSYKKENEGEDNKENLVYKFYNIEKDNFEKNGSFYNLIKKASIRITDDLIDNDICNRNENNGSSSNSNMNNDNNQFNFLNNKNETKWKIPKVTENLIKEVQEYINSHQKKFPAFEKMNFEIEKVYIKKHEELNENIIYVSIKEKYCPFVGRPHKRDSNPLYLQISYDVFKLKCHDEDCKKNNQRLPDCFNITIEYNENWKLIANVFKSNFLEEHLFHYVKNAIIGSHFRVAKLIHYIYRDKFRVESSKGDTWYYFQNHKWKVNAVNLKIFISEEIPKILKQYHSCKMINFLFTFPELPENNKKTCLENLKKLKDNIDKLIMKLETHSYKNSVITETVALFFKDDEKFYEKLDSQYHLIGFENGIYDLNRGIFRDGLPTDYITFSTGYNYQEYDENNPKLIEILKFFREVYVDDDVREYILFTLSRSLHGKPDEKFYILTGEGQNGKSTLCKLLKNVFGDYYASLDTSSLTTKKLSGSSASPDIIKIKGKRLVSFQEPNEDDKINMNLIKQISGGDDINARELYKSQTTFKPQAHLFLCCNNLPTIKGNDGGTWRRIRDIVHSSSFKEILTDEDKDNDRVFKKDPHMEEKLESWTSILMSLLIHYYEKYKKNDYIIYEPESVKSSTKEYQKSNDIFLNFIEEIYDIDKNRENIILLKDIYEEYTRWFVDQGYVEKAFSKPLVKKHLERLYGVEKKLRSKKGWFFIKKNEENEISN
jgi:P4 family phage/plasmid primase-like protien